MTDPKFYYNKTEYNSSVSDLPPPYPSDGAEYNEQREQQVGLLHLDDSDNKKQKSKILRLLKRWYKMVFVLLLIWIVILLVKNLDKPEVIVSTETSETYGMEKQKTTVAPPQDTPTVVLPDPQAESTEIQEEIVLTEQDNVTSTTTITEVIESNGFTEQNVTTTITEVMDTNGMTNVITETTVAETSTVSDSILCKGEPASSWDTLPHQLSFARNIKLVLKGKVTGQITVKPLKDQQGLITSDVKFAPNELQKEMKYDITQGDLTTLVLDFPQDKGCIDVNLTVGLPKYASRLLLDVQNVDIKLFPLHVTLMDVRNTNGNVVLGNWAGDDLSVVNSNGYIHANQIEAKETVHIENSNGPIQIGKSVEADSKLNILNKNGPIETIDTLSAEDNIRIETSNGVIRSNDLRGESIQVSSTNEAIYLNRLEAETIAIRGSNGPIVASITEAKDSEVRVISNNGRVDLNVTNNFEGRFSLRTSQGNVAINEDVTYKVNTTNIKTGYKKKGKGIISVMTTNNDVNVLFN